MLRLHAVTSRSWLACALGVGLASVVTPVARAQADVDRALVEARDRAAGGDAVAQFSLGSILYYGTAQTAEGLEWFSKAAAQGYAPAEFQLGQVYEAGFGVTASETQALGWYRRAADHRSAAGQRAVGDFYLKGKGVPADPREALRWFTLAANGDDLRAQYQLGQLYFSGEGVPRDYIEAYVWFTIAAGQTPLMDNRKQLIELSNITLARMSPAQAAEAKGRVARWSIGAAR